MAINTESTIFDHLTALTESARCRLLLLLEDHELTVSDLCTVLQLPQSTVSRHLKILLDRGWVDSRRDGTRRLYHGTVDQLDDTARGLWQLTRGAVASSRSGLEDRARLESVLARQRSRSREFFDESSARWDALRDELFGQSFYLYALVGLVPSQWRVADLGCGTGTVAEALAPFVRHVIGVDASPAMLAHAEARLDRFDNVELRHGDLESLPVDTDDVDVATMILVLHHIAHPAAVIAETARCLKPGGRILIVDMLPHDRVNYRHEMGHVWLGFSEDAIDEYLKEAGFGNMRFAALTPVPEAKGPNLFAVSATLKE